ncbi:MAG: RNA polymerase sigma factor [Capsulimonadales bacterium]|nr:RNA polymerase sigma factor [Capsulimonadales bacterium]
MTVKPATDDRIPRHWMHDLPNERPRLVRLCARLTGSYDAAEDLAQETLLEAWRLAGNLRDDTAWRSFVSGIARNLCLRWQRKQGEEGVHRAPSSVIFHSGADFTGSAEIEPADPIDLAYQFERRALTALLDRALYQLPLPSRTLLVERYMDELPQAEMAEKRGLTENALGVRLHRAKEHLHRLLSAPPYREEAADFGLLAPDRLLGWQETRLWCPRCGQRHLLGRFDTDAHGQPEFALRCPDCDYALGQDFTSRHASLPTREVLQGIRGFKPALNRISAWWHGYFEQGRARGYADCPFCGHQASFLTSPPLGTDPRLAGLSGLFIVCSRCHRLSCLTASGMAFHTPAVRRFWREYPRLQLLAETPVRFENTEAVQVTFRSVTGSAVLEAVLSRTTFETLSVRTSSSPTER